MSERSAVAWRSASSCARALLAEVALRKLEVRVTSYLEVRWSVFRGERDEAGNGGESDKHVLFAWKSDSTRWRCTRCLELLNNLWGSNPYLGVQFHAEVVLLPSKIKKGLQPTKDYFQWQPASLYEEEFWLSNENLDVAHLNHDQRGKDYSERGQSPNMEHRPLQRPQPQCQSQVQTSVTRDSIFHVLVPSVSRRKLSAVPWLQNKNKSYQMHRQCIGEVFVPDDEHEKAVCVSVQFLLCHLSVEKILLCFFFVQQLPTFWLNSSLDLSSCGEYPLQNLWQEF